MAMLPAAALPLTGRADAAQMRSTNMGLILRYLRAHGPRSRAKLAAETGLSKATVSTLVADLTELGLVHDVGADRPGTVGRPGVMLELDGGRVCGIGVEINVDHVSLVVADLTGAVLIEELHPLAAATVPVGEMLRIVAELVSGRLEELRADGKWVASLTVSPPGIIDYDDGTVRFAPNMGWRSVPLIGELKRLIGPGAPSIHLENDAKLSALAEYATYEPTGVSDLIFVTGDIGIGVGIVADGRLVRGWSGFSGEVGHLQLDPENRPCNCGRTGCWELCIGLNELLRLAGDDDDVIHDPERPLEERLETIRERADAGDERTRAALATLTANLARGLGILVDVLNPKVIVLGGYFTSMAPLIVPSLATELAARRMDDGSAVELAASRLGISSAAYGGAIVALEGVFADPTRVPAT